VGENENHMKFKEIQQLTPVF